MGHWKLSLYSRSFAVLRAMRRNIVGTEFLKNQNTSGWPPTAGQIHAPLPANNTHQRLHTGPSIRGKRYTHKTSVFKRPSFKTSETSGLQNGRFTKCQVYKTSGLQNVRLPKNIHKYSVLVVGGNPQVMLQPCSQAKWWLCFIFYFWGFFVIYHHNG